MSGQMNLNYIEVAYFKEGAGHLLGVKVPAGMSVEGILKHCDIDNAHGVGVWGKMVELNHVPKDQDRIEIYPPLQIDPREKRRRLVESKRRKK